ncbi:hypothetical protein B0H12DRAFT_1149391 [Mycena haematopus]|nr:hypothetical protein B0H12DRAFT_1149391 [Mycena haematopus]
MSCATPSTLSLFVVSSLLHSAVAQTDATVDGSQNSKVAITGAIIGGARHDTCSGILTTVPIYSYTVILLIIALVAVAVYGIERCIARRRAAKAGGMFTPFPTTQSKEDSEPYRYLMLPPPTPLAKNDSFHSGQAASPLASPSILMSSTLSSVKPSADFDPYANGPFYPGPNERVPEPPVSPVHQSMTPSLRTKHGVSRLLGLKV